MKTIPVSAFVLVRNTVGKLCLLAALTSAATAGVQSRYYGHAAVHDRYGVIAPWYQGLNGQCDFRVRIAAETLKRYPWTARTNAITVPRLRLQRFLADFLERRHHPSRSG